MRINVKAAPRFQKARRTAGEDGQGDGKGEPDGEGQRGHGAEDGRDAAGLLLVQQRGLRSE